MPESHIKDALNDDEEASLYMYLDDCSLIYMQGVCNLVFQTFWCGTSAFMMHVLSINNDVQPFTTIRIYCQAIFSPE